MLDGHALGGGDHLIGRHHMAGCERALERGAAFGDGTDHAHFGLEGLDGERHARAQATAAQRHDDVGDVRHVFEDFHGDGALAAQHFVIIERRHVDHALLFAQLGGVRGGLVEHITPKHHVGAVGLGGVHLEWRGHGGHADGGFRAALAGGVGHALRVVAGGGGDDAAGKFLLGQGCDFVVGTADLEGAGDLQVLGLEQNLVAGHVAQYRGGDDFGVTSRAVQTFGGEFQLRRMVAPQCLQYILLFHKAHSR